MQLLAKVGHSFMFKIDAHNSSVAIFSTHIHLLEHFVHVVNFQIIEFNTAINLGGFSIWCWQDGALIDSTQIVNLKTILDHRIADLHQPLHSYWLVRSNHTDN